ncbi:MAG: undecaprenyl-diphosphate phosphatase [Candidatus Paracaedibacteraceae bacterium]|nr:undecaprenyl-diphosphate phosphatase [Candidatus Paracaedibacteraceae bacterium]
MLTLLAIIQGITEFLPVSSTAHLIIIAKYFGNIYPGVHYLVVLHLGSMVAILLYFWKDLWEIFKGWLSLFRGRITAYFRLSLIIVVATIPVMILGLFLFKIIEKPQNTPYVIGVNSVVFGILLYVADLRKKVDKPLLNITYLDAFLIGVAQAFALLPGASRSGSCMMAARALGYSRMDSTKFAFLLGIPAILGASVLKLTDIQWGDPTVDIELFVYGSLISFAVSYLVIVVMMRLLERISFLPFALYRVLLGVILLVFF